MSAHRSALEKKIQADVLAAIGCEPDLLIFKNSVGHAKHIDENTGKVWYVPYGLTPGSPDLVGILAGRWFCLEVKQVGEDATAEQKKCHEIWRYFGAFVEVVHSVAEAKDALSRARRLTR